MNHPPHNPYPAAGEVIDGKYQIERMLGEGGMGAVAKATHLLRRAPVALKFMAPAIMSFPGAVERFLNEGVAASQIDSDHVVHIFDVGKLPSGAPYLVMEYMAGHDLAEILQKEGQPGLETARAIHFTLQTLRGLQVAHDAGIIHRDMKPSNCFVVDKEGEIDFVKLLDFGISKVGSGKSASLTQTNSALGTPLYMSPEQAKSPRDVDLRSDLYSVGVILYELLTGRTPFNSESGEFTEILFKLFTTDPPPIRSLREDLPPDLAAAVHKALVREPNDRYSTAGEFGAALGAWADPRSARVLQRLRQHVPGRASTVPATQQMGGAAPVAAFSQLNAAATAASPQQQPRGAVAITPAPQTGSHAAYAPDSRVSTADEAVAATQYGAQGGAQSMGLPPVTQVAAGGNLAARTDLGATRDASLPSPAPKKTSPLVFAVPAIIALGLVGGGAWKMTHSTAAAPATIDTATPDTTATIPSATPPVASAAPSAPPSASASATPVASTVPHIHHGGDTPQTPPKSGDGRVHLKDLKPVE